MQTKLSSWYFGLKLRKKSGLLCRIISIGIVSLEGNDNCLTEKWKDRNINEQAFQSEKKMGGGHNTDTENAAGVTEWHPDTGIQCLPQSAKWGHKPRFITSLPDPGTSLGYFMKEGGKDDHPLLSKSHSVSLPTLITEPLLNKRTNQRPSANTEGESLANTRVHGEGTVKKRHWYEKEKNIHVFASL